MKQCLLKISIAVFLFAAGISSSYAQVPTEQDCLGAIPICGPIYTTASSTFGSGNYPNEDPPSTCLVPGELNSQWFIFTVISSGDLAFTTYPVNFGADYDWALYNLTNATCEDILTNSSLSVSCNSSQYGVTGMSSTGVGNWNGPGPTNAFNYLYPVVAGETYVLNMNNWSGSTGGYTLDFSASTATIFDSVKPKIDTILPVLCTDSTITFSFSEKIICSSVQDADFELSGPWGPYTLSNVSGAACLVGGTQEITFTADISPKILHGGNYQLKLTNNSGSVEDLCGNIADPDSLLFYVDGVIASIDSVLSPFCEGDNGVIFSSGTNGSLPYTFTLNSLSQSTGNFTGLSDTTYNITITDAGGCFDTAIITLYPATGAVTGLVDQFTDAKCYNSCDGTILVSGSGGVPPYSYDWSNGAATAGIFDLCIGTYTVIITDTIGCKDTLSVIIDQPTPLIFSLDSISDISCYNYFDGYIGVSVSGGTPNYFYNWLPYGGNSAIASQLNANTYTFEVIDGNGCHYDTVFTLTQPDEMLILYPGDITTCLGTPANLDAPIIGGTPPYTVQWTTGSTDNPYLFDTPIDSVISVFAVDTRNCTSPQVDYRVQVIHPPVVDLGNDTTLCQGDVLIKNAFIPGASYEWQDGSAYYDQEISEAGLYWVRAYNQCFEDVDSVSIDFDDCKTCVHVPDAFTPNADGLNDELLPIIGCDFTRYEFKVFNRWGQMIYWTNDPEQGWDGRYEGKLSEMGTYVWELDYAGTQHSLVLDKQAKGFAVLLR